MFLLLIPGIFSLMYKFSSDTHYDGNRIRLSKNPSYFYTVAISLIWPTLAVFNITAPIIAQSKFHSINVAAVMEFLIGAATAIIGFCHIVTTRYLNHVSRILCVFLILLISTLLIYLYPDYLIIIFTSTFIIGITFGYLRIELRAFLAKNFTPEQASEIVSKGNSWSGPLVLIYCLAYYFNSRSNGILDVSIIFPLSFIIGAAIISYLLISDSKSVQEVVDEFCN